MYFAATKSDERSTGIDSDLAMWRSLMTWIEMRSGENE